MAEQMRQNPYHSPAAQLNQHSYLNNLNSS
jgi:hypothetical protein